MATRAPTRAGSLVPLAVALALGVAIPLALGGCDDDDGPFSIDTRSAFGAAVLVAYQDGDAWLAAAETEPGVYAVPATDAVSVAVVCATSTSPRVAVHRMTRSADRSVAATCGYAGDDSRDYPATLIPSSAKAYVHDFWRSLGDPAPVLWAPAGRWDIVATSDTKVLIRRGVVLPPAAPLVFDLERDGSELVPLTVELPTVTGDESVGASYAVVTASGARGTTPPGIRANQLLAAPDDALEAGDRHRVYLRVSRGSGTFRTVETTSRDRDALTSPLPADMGPVTASRGGGLSVEWTRAPAGDHEVWLHTGGASVSWSATTSADWLADHGQRTAGRWTIPDLTSVPGWSPHWISAPTGADSLNWSMSATSRFADGERDVTQSSMVSGWMAGAK